MKTLYDISWQVPESRYREDKALSYSTLARFEREGFNELPHLFDKIQSPSLLFGSAVDTLITSGEKEFEDNFIVVKVDNVDPSVMSIIRILHKKYSSDYRTLSDIPDNDILDVLNEVKYQPRWRDITRISKIKTTGEEFYSALYIANGKLVLSPKNKEEIDLAVKALKESPSTERFFRENNPFDNFYREYQLKFKANLNGIPYRCMADLLITDHKNKIVYPIDLKTSGHPEWDFFESFIKWKYSIQARLYWRIIRANMDKDDYFKSFKLADYQFVVVNKNSLIPLVWRYEDTTKLGTLWYGKRNQIEVKDPEDVGKVLYYYLTNNVKIPKGIEYNVPNSLNKWLNTL